MTSSVGSTLTTLVLVPLLAWRVHARFRRASGRQRLSRYRGPVSTALYTLLIGAVAWSNRHHGLSLAAFALMLSAGAGLAAYALTRTTFEATPQGLFYTPHGPIGISLAVLFVARLAYRLIEVYVLDGAASRSFAEFAQSPLTLGPFGLMAGYQAWYVLALWRWRHAVLKRRRHRDREAPQDTPEPKQTHDDR